MCERWQSFDNFYEDMAASYFDGASLDRIDNDGNYSKENCRWVTMTDQMNNTSRNRFFDYKGRMLTLCQLAREQGIKSSTIRQRFYGLKWSLEKCVETPVRHCTSGG